MNQIQNQAKYYFEVPGVFKIFISREDRKMEDTKRCKTYDRKWQFKNNAGHSFLEYDS